MKKLTRPWHCPLPPAPWPNVAVSTPPTHAQIGQLITAALERQTRRKHGAK